MRSFFSRALVLFWLWFATGALAGPVAHATSGIVFPEVVAGFERTGFHDYESKHPGLGFSCSYRAAGMFATIYVYTAGLAAVPADIRHPALRKLREQTVREIVEFAHGRGETAKQTIRRTVTARTSMGERLILFDGFTIDAPKGGLRSTYVWLWTARGHFVKVRLTRRGGDEVDQQSMHSFVEAVAQLAAE
jgi:hypothetical protein